jgi:Protein of unknown function (DUF3605)
MATSNDSKDARIILPELEYGYRTKPLEWAELIQIILVEKNLAKLSRSVEQQEEYMMYMRDIKKQWKSVYHFILHSKFGFKKRLVSGSSLDASAAELWESYPPASKIKEPKKVLVLNDFPYYNAPGIQHYILWKIASDVTDDEIDEAGQELRDQWVGVCDVLHWKNPPHLKSVPDIDHVHILVHRPLASK